MFEQLIKERMEAVPKRQGFSTNAISDVAAHYELKKKLGNL